MRLIFTLFLSLWLDNKKLDSGALSYSCPSCFLNGLDKEATDDSEKRQISATRGELNTRDGIATNVHNHWGV